MAGDRIRPKVRRANLRSIDGAAAVPYRLHRCPSPTPCSPVIAELETALGALGPRLGTPETEPLPLDGGITNRNFRMTVGGQDVVVRLPGKDTELLGIDRLAERDATEAAARAG